MAEEIVEVRVQFLRGPTSENMTYTGRAGEITFDDEKGHIHIHDGVVAGGYIFLNKSEVYSRSAIDALIDTLNNRMDALQTQVNGLTKENLGLDQVDNTSDLDKPISTAVQDALDDKVDWDMGRL